MIEEIETLKYPRPKGRGSNLKDLMNHLLLKSNNSGTSLVEVAVVLMVTGIMASLVGISFYNFNTAREKVAVVAALDEVAAAQRARLRQVPSTRYSQIDFGQLHLFLPNAQMPRALNGWTVGFNTSPPYATKDGRNYEARHY